MLALDVDGPQHHQEDGQPPQPHTLEWHIAAYTVPARAGAGGPKGAAGKGKGAASGNGNTRTILKGLAGRAEAGELVAVMGPSGTC